MVKWHDYLHRFYILITIRKMTLLDYIKPKAIYIK